MDRSGKVGISGKRLAAGGRLAGQYAPGAHHLIGGLLHGDAVGVDRPVRRGIGGLSLRLLLAYPDKLVLALQEWTYRLSSALPLLLLQTLVDGLRRGIQADNYASCFHGFPVFKEGYGAAANGNHPALTRACFPHGVTFQPAEVLLSVLLEDSGYGLARLLRNLPVNVDEPPAQDAGNHLAHR